MDDERWRRLQPCHRRRLLRLHRRSYASKSGCRGFTLEQSPYARVKGYSVVNARAIRRVRSPGDHYELTLWVANAFDSRSFSMVTPASTGSGGYFALPSDPRYFGATLKASF